MEKNNLKGDHPELFAKAKKMASVSRVGARMAKSITKASKKA
jgi:hypothetical protein